MIQVEFKTLNNIGRSLDIRIELDWHSENIEFIDGSPFVPPGENRFPLMRPMDDS
jgi:hypothetical protein